MPCEKASTVNMRGESPSWLMKHFEQDANLLVIDCRSLSLYSKAHVEGSINISVPSLMLRRLKKGNIPLANFINTEYSKAKFQERRTYERIVVYDESTEDNQVNESSVLGFLLSKLSEDNLVSFLDGGFRRFEESFPHLCQCGDGIMSSSVLSLANLSITDGIPSPIISQDSNNNFNMPHPTRPSAKDLLFRPDSLGPTKIVPNLYLGNKADSSNLSCLKKLEISHILNVTHDLPNEFENLAGFRYLKLPLQDNWDGNVLDLFPQAFKFIDHAIDKGESVLVHCLGGISRSSTMIIAYLMFKYGYPLNNAYDLVKSKKSNIAPNFNFMGQLLNLERIQKDLATPTSPSCGSPGSFSAPNFDFVGHHHLLHLESIQQGLDTPCGSQSPGSQSDGSLSSSSYSSNDSC